MKTQLLNDIDTTGNTLVHLLSSFSEEEFNTVPFEGSWTAGQVAEHIWKAGDCGILYGPTVAVNRVPDEKVDAIKTLFLNFGIRMTAPESIRPGDGHHSKAAALDNIREIWSKLTAAANTLNLEEECTAFEVPGFGPFTRLEWIQFINIHTQRHIHQLQNIQARVLRA